MLKLGLMKTDVPPFSAKLDDRGMLLLGGALSVHTLARAKETLNTMRGEIAGADLSKLDTLDTAGAFFLSQWLQDVPLKGLDKQHKQLLGLVGKLEATPPAKPKKHPVWVQALIRVGAWAAHARMESVEVITFAGKSAVMLAQALSKPKRLRVGAISQHIESIGIDALPIIGLMAFLISIVLAYQGVAQLRPYGGEIFTVNLVALSILREMGVLLTAIMVAGRSGSAFTAEIGVMKAREEVDALEVMGLRPFDMLITPRLVAIVIALPLLTFYADMMGLLGGFVISHSLIDIGWTEYWQRVRVAAQGADLFVGMFKAPVLAFMIGVVGCMHGLRVSGSAESVGHETTAAVVKSIFLVLMIDAVFSILFEQWGI